MQSGSEVSQVIENVAEREGFYYRRCLQVTVKPTFPR
jgi:hypothetical protein